MSRGDVVDLRRALVVVYEQVKLDGRRERGLAVLAAHNPEDFAILPFALRVHEPEDDGQDGALEQLKLERLAELSRRQAAEQLDEVDVLRRIFLAEVVRVQRVVVVQVAQHDFRDLMNLGAGGDRTVEHAAEIIADGLLARTGGLFPSHRTSFR